MVILNDTSVRAHGHINASLLVVLITSLGNLNHSSSLTTADTFSLAGNADGTATDTNLDEISASLSEEPEALTIHNVACAYLDLIAVTLTDPVNGTALPLAETLRGVNAQNINTSLNKSRNTLSVVACVNACAHHIALVLVQ
ncbi:hypothetical protein EVA_10703 [gut metagenome]|uniref:Uncharacterized protein n=1 Tax=gut metagenome TaxID=749906 RepID=J9CM71_9ZZZZ